MSSEVLFTYWGRRGALSDFTLELAQEAVSQHAVTVSVSCFNELYSEFESFGESLFPVTTFESTVGAITSLRSIFKLRRACADRFLTDRTRVIINLMPHVWFPAVMPVAKAMGIRCVTIVHDANHHPGDPSGALTTRLFLRQARAADHVVTLSGYVRDRLLEKSIVPPDRITTLFHPDLTFRTAPTIRSVNPPLRILFFGRMFRYKQLDLFIDAIALLHAAGAPIEATLLGAGNIGPYRQQLQQLRVHVENRWLSSHELGDQLRQHDVLAVCHSEASQSGAIAAAFGAGLPVVAFGVGGIPEQVTHEVTGLIAADHTAASFAGAILRLLDQPELLDRLKLGVQASMPERSMKRFAGELWKVAERQMRYAEDVRRDAVDLHRAATSRRVAA